MKTNTNNGIRSPITESNNVDISIISFSVESNDKNAPVVDKSKDCAFTVHFILDGKGYVLLNGIRHSLSRNMLFVSFPHSNVQICQEATDPYKLAWFIVDGLQVKSLLTRIGITKDSPFLELPENRTIRSLFSRTPYVCAQHTDLSDLYAHSAFYNILYNILILRKEQQNHEHNRTCEAHIAKALNYISIHYNDPTLNLNTLAKELYLTPKYLSYIFKKVTGNTFSHILQTKRISVANTMLQRGESNISAIAYATGFSSPYYFSNIYKKHNGVSPRTHIQQQQQTNSSPSAMHPKS